MKSFSLALQKSIWPYGFNTFPRNVNEQLQLFTDAVFPREMGFFEKKKLQPWLNVNIFFAHIDKRKYKCLWRKSGLIVHHEIYKKKKDFDNQLIKTYCNKKYSLKFHNVKVIKGTVWYSAGFA